MDTSLVKEAARIVVQNQRAIRTIWEDIDHFKQYGQMRDDTVVYKRNVQDMSIGEIITACFTLPSWLTKAKQKHQSMEEGPEKVKLGVDIKIKEQELAEIKKLRE